jgi:hypothetical protein
VALLAVLGFAAVIALGVFAWRREQARRDALRSWAAGQGWTYVDRDDAWSSRYGGTPFGTGESRRATNVISGAWQGRSPFTAFDYRYQTSSTDSQGRRTTTNHPFGVTVLTLPAVLPRMELTPDGVFARIATAFGGADLNVEHEGFNRAFRVRANDERVAHAMLHPRAVETLLAFPDLSMRVQDGVVLAWWNGRIDAESVVAHLTVLDRFTGQVPRFVWQDHGYRPPA